MPLSHIQGNKNKTVIPRKCTQRKQVKSELMLSTFFYNVEVLKETSMDNCLALLIKPLCIFGFPETVLPGP